MLPVKLPRLTSIFTCRGGNSEQMDTKRCNSFWAALLHPQADVDRYSRISNVLFGGTEQIIGAICERLVRATIAALDRIVWLRAPISSRLVPGEHRGLESDRLVAGADLKPSGSRRTPGAEKRASGCGRRSQAVWFPENTGDWKAIVWLRAPISSRLVLRLVPGEHQGLKSDRLVAGADLKPSGSLSGSRRTH